MNRRIRIQRLALKTGRSGRSSITGTRSNVPGRLTALKAVWNGQTLADACRTRHLRRKTLEHWLDWYLHGGFKTLLAPERRRVPQALSCRQRRVLRYILLHKTPADYGLDSYQWTARRAQALIAAKWNIHLGLGRLYPLFDQFGLSHQRVHRDYGPPRPRLQAAFVDALEKKGGGSQVSGPRSGGAG